MLPKWSCIQGPWAYSGVRDPLPSTWSLSRFFWGKPSPYSRKCKFAHAGVSSTAEFTWHLKAVAVLPICRISHWKHLLPVITEQHIEPVGLCAMTMPSLQCWQACRGASLVMWEGREICGFCPCRLGFAGGTAQAMHLLPICTENFMSVEKITSIFMHLKMVPPQIMWSAT